MFLTMYSYIPVLDYMRKTYGPEIGYGRHRVVFRDGDYVYKVPLSLEGVDDNYREASGPEWSDDPEKFADCVIISCLGVDVLLMEYVEHAGWPSEPCPPELEWTWYIDCGQVGYTKDGRLVAYDWGY